MSRRPRIRSSHSLSTDYGCTLSGIFNVLGQVRDAVVLMHSPIGCTHLNISNQLGTDLRTRALCADVPALGPASRLFTTDLRDREVIFGGEDKLAATLREVDRTHHPRVIFVVPSCVTETIGDDIEAAAESVEGEVAARIVVVRSGGFLSGGFRTGYLRAMELLVQEFVQPADTRRTDQVNIIAEKNMLIGEELNFREVARLLGLMGVTVRARLVTNTPLDDIAGMAKAGLNIVRDADFGLAAAEMLESRFGMPYVSGDYPIGVQATRDWLMDVGEALGRATRAREAADQEETAIAAELERLREALSGRKALVSTTVYVPIWLLEVCQELGVTVAQVNVQYPSAERATNADVQPPADGPLMTYCASIDAALEAGPPVDLVLAPYSYAPAQEGVAFQPIPGVPPVGYRGLLELGRAMAYAVRNPREEGWRRYARQAYV